MATLFCDDGREYDVASIPLDEPSPCVCKWRPQWSDVYQCFGHPNIPGHCYEQKSGGQLMRRIARTLAKFNGTDERESCVICTPFEVGAHCGPLGDGQTVEEIPGAQVPELDLTNPDAYVIRPASNARYLIVSNGIERWAQAMQTGSNVPACTKCWPGEQGVSVPVGWALCITRYHTCREGRLAISYKTEQDPVQPGDLCDAPIDPYCGEDCSFEFDGGTGLPLAVLNLHWLVDDSNPANYSGGCFLLRSVDIDLPVYSFDGCFTIYLLNELTLEELTGNTYVGSALDTAGAYNDFQVNVTFDCSGAWKDFQISQKKNLPMGAIGYVAQIARSGVFANSATDNCCHFLFENNGNGFGGTCMGGYAGCPGGSDCVTISGTVVPV